MRANDINGIDATYGELTLNIHEATEREERTILHRVPSPTGLTRWNIQRIPNMFIEVACHM